MFDCMDCGVDTSKTHEYYMVHDEIWLFVNPGDYGMLCIGCLEERLGRELTPYDFTDAPVNSEDWIHSDRLKSRIGY